MKEGLEKKANLLLQLTGEVPKELIDSIKKIAANAALSAVVQSEASLAVVESEARRAVVPPEASVVGVHKRRLEEVNPFLTPAVAATKRVFIPNSSPAGSVTSGKAVNLLESDSE